MARYDFINGGGVLQVIVQSQGGLYNPVGMSLATPSITLANKIIKLFDSGIYFNSYGFNDIGLIDGVQPVDIDEAFELLTVLISTILLSGGGGGGGGVTTDTVQSITARKDFTVAAGPAATFTATSGNTVNITATTGSGLYSTSVDGPGVEAFSVNDPGVFGYSSNSAGVFAHSQNSIALIVDSLNLANLSDLANFNINSVPQVRITNSGKLITKTSDTISAALNLPIGVAPTTPVEGDLWLENATLTGLKIRLGGVTRTITIT
jgi:hypothetical protein